MKVSHNALLLVGVLFFLIGLFMEPSWLRPVATFISVDLSFYRGIISNNTANLIVDVLYLTPQYIYILGIAFVVLSLILLKFEWSKKNFRLAEDYFRSFLQKLNKIYPGLPYLLVLAFITLLGFYIRVIRLSHMVLIDSDSFHYLLAAKTLFFEGSYLEPWGFGKITPVYFPGYPLLIAASFYLFGVHGQLANLISLYLGTLSIPLLYLLGKEVFNEKTGVIAAFMLALTPVHICTGSVAMSDIPSLFFVLLTLVALVKSLKSKSKLFAVISGIGLAFSILMRFTNFLLFIPLCALWLLKSLGKDTTQRKTLTIILLIGVSLSLVYPSIRMFETKRIDFWWPSTVAVNPYFPHLDNMLSWRHALTSSAPGSSETPNLIRYFVRLIFTPSIFDTRYIPGFFLFAGLLAIIGFQRAKKTMRVFSSMFFLLWILAYIVFFASHYYLEMRFLLPTLPAIYLFAAVGFLLLVERLFPRNLSRFNDESKASIHQVATLMAILAVALLVNTFSISVQPSCDVQSSVMSAISLKEKATPMGVFFQNVSGGYLVISGRWIEMSYYLNSTVLPLHLVDSEEIQAHYPDGIPVLVHTTTTYNFGEHYPQIVGGVREELKKLDPKKYPIIISTYPESNKLVEYDPLDGPLPLNDDHYQIL
ncbi:MAG: glycosyltransferase family 39 protein [Candidatus Altiarchaeota archaeon]